MELFDLPPQQLGQDTHLAVFGELPASLADALHTSETGDLVLQLLDRGWRKGQIAARVGDEPAGRDPVATVNALLRRLLDEQPPDARWREEKAARDALKPLREEPASEESRQAWLAQIRADLGAVKGRTKAPVRRVRPACNLCGQESSYFVTKDVRLCDGCVVLLSTGAVRLSEAG